MLDKKDIDATFKEVSAKMKQKFKEGGGPSWPVHAQLKLYGLYTQALKGDATYETKPYMIDFINLQKWNSWDKEKGKSKQTAKKEYIQAAHSFLNALENKQDLSKWTWTST